MDASEAPVDLPRGLMDFSVRRLRGGDAERLSDFYRSLSAHSIYFFQPYHDSSVAAMRVVVNRALEGRDLSLVALEPGGRVIAHLFYSDVAAEVPHLGIGLRDEYQDFGLGTTLFAYLLALGKHVLRKPAVGLTVMKENLRALRLYAKFGFKVVRDHTFRHPDDSVEMRLDFAGPPEVIS